MALLSVKSGSIIENSDGSNRTATSISTQIVIRVGSTPIGAVKSIRIQERREVKAIDEVGTDGHIDSVPTRSADITGSCERVRYDRLRITEAFSRGFLHAKSQRVPFDIDIYDNWNGDAASTVVTTIKNVWITSLSYGYSADDWIIVDNMEFMAEDISSSVQGGPAAQGGARGIILQTDSEGIERQTDRGARRGALDAPGLINSVLGNL